MCLLANKYFVSIVTYYNSQMADSTKQTMYETGYRVLIVVSAIASVIGWITVGNQTKSNYFEMEYDEE